MKRASLFLAVLLTFSFVMIPVSAIGFGSVQGTVKNSLGQPISNVRVTMTYNGQTIDTDYTDSSGYYHVYYSDILFNKISVILKFVKTGYSTKTVGVYVYPGSVTTKNVVLSGPPSKVGGLEVTSISYDSISLKWNPNPESNIYRYEVFRNDVKIAQVAGTDYIDTGLNDDTTYTYKVRALNTAGTYGPFSDPVSAKTEYKPRWYALIVSGSDPNADDPTTTNRHPHDARLMYNTLIDHYGFTPASIHLLSAHEMDPIDYTFMPRNDPATPSNVQKHIQQIADVCTDKDYVLVWWTGHGQEDIFTCPTYYTTERVTATQLDAWLDNINCKQMFIYLGPCHSGSFIDNLNDKNNRAIYTSCKGSESAYANSQHSFWPWAIINGLDPDLDAETADTNADGRVSLYELYNYAVNYINALSLSGPQTPQRWVGTLINDSNQFIGDAYY